MPWRRPTPELSGAGGRARSHWQLRWPARVRSSDLGQINHHGEHSERNL